MVGNQLRQGLMMLNNEEIVRELYAAAEGSGKDIATFASFFSELRITHKSAAGGVCFRL
ncbi:hypothetical protein [Caballeronia sp. 15711]|uniref:hypothetical protein n=1 Tax=Caballeronia sp. 15711 TaxID=3391029 RepID=UPI0039E2339A